MKTHQPAITAAAMAARNNIMNMVTVPFQTITIPNDARFDVDHLPVFMLTRTGDETDIGILAPRSPTGEFHFSIKCSPDQHDDFVRRFRRKLGVAV